MEQRETRSAPINIRAMPRQRGLIDRAAAILNKPRSEFMLEAACRAAEEVLADRSLFMLDEEAFEALRAVLDEQVADNSSLGKLLARKTPWED